MLTERGDRTEVCRQTSRQRGSQSSSTSTTSSSARYKTCSININTASHIHPTVSHIFPAIFRQSLRGRVLRLTYACAPPDEPACDPVHEQGPERAQGDGAQAKRLPGPHLSRLVRYPPCYSYSRRHVWPFDNRPCSASSCCLFFSSPLLFFSSVFSSRSVLRYLITSEAAHRFKQAINMGLVPKILEATLFQRLSVSLNPNLDLSFLTLKVVSALDARSDAGSDRAKPLLEAACL